MTGDGELSLVERQVAAGRVVPGSLAARLVARDAVEAAERLAKERRDARNARRRARRAEGKGTRPAGDTAPVVEVPVEPRRAPAPVVVPPGELMDCERCGRRVHYLRHRCEVPTLPCGVYELTDADHARADAAGAGRWRDGLPPAGRLW